MAETTENYPTVRDILYCTFLYRLTVIINKILDFFFVHLCASSYFNSVHIKRQTFLLASYINNS